MIREAAHYGRMTTGLMDLLRTPPPADPDGLLRAQLGNREATFLDLLRRTVFADASHPYSQMFRLAGCRFEDLADSVRRDGLEAALAALHREGVYLAHDEFKGKKQIIRSGRHIPADAHSFVNPLVRGLMEGTSSGSRSAGTRTRHNTRLRVYREAYDILLRREFELDGRAQIETKTILPDISGFGTCLRAARLARGVDRWFTAGGHWKDSGHYRAVTSAFILLARLGGARVPFPTYLPPNDFSPIAEWIAQRRATGIPSWVSILVSPAVRVAAAALDKGLDISGTLFQVGGEALTEAKRRTIESAGVEICVGYWISEVGFIGHSCRRMQSGNCVHLFDDSVAVISYPRIAPFSDVTLDSLLFTSLLPMTPRILINAEMDDSGVIEAARCDCTLARAGFSRRISGIFSFGKLTGQGVTLVGSEILRILEEVLPAKLGGGPGDYQLVEEEGISQTQLTLRASPRINAIDLDRVRRCFWNELRSLEGGSPALRIWKHSEALKVVIAEPFTTRTGKVHALHLFQPAKAHAYES